MKSNENKRPTSLLIPKTSPLARTKFLFAMVAMMIPDIIAPTTPQTPASPPRRYAIIVMIAVDAI